METACLRIQFIPFFQETFVNDTKCCLEIVPEVLCVSNLDKLKWKQETNYIEYNIPMTHKVILRKQDIIKGNSDDIAKTYHSCVDFLLSSTKLDWHTGGVSKIISDPFIPNKLPDPTITRDELINFAAIDKNFGLINSCVTTDGNMIENSEFKESEEVIANDSTKRELLYEEHRTNDVMCDNTTNTENVIPIFLNDLLFEWPKISNTSEFKTSVKPESTITGKIDSKLPKDNESNNVNKRKLTLSPLCSVNTQETTSFRLNNKSSKAITCKIFESHKDLMSLKCLGTDIKSIKNVCVKPKGRSPPEIRIAKYVRYMEKELSPLNTTLNDLIYKCTLLGIYQTPTKNTKKTNKTFLLYKSMCMCSKRNVKETREKALSNRAVYSIVFDG